MPIDLWGPIELLLFMYVLSISYLLQLVAGFVCTTCCAASHFNYCAVCADEVYSCRACQQRVVLQHLDVSIASNACIVDVYGRQCLHHSMVYVRHDA